MEFGLPKTVFINGAEHEIRSDYRAVLDICSALSDPDLSDEDKGIVVLSVFYMDKEKIDKSDYREAIEKCMDFISGGEEAKPNKKSNKIMDWEQDFKYIVSPINRMLGKDIRDVDYMHWWTFLSYYYEIGPDCVFSQILRIRGKLSRHEKLDDEEKRWYKNNPDTVNIKSKYTTNELEIINKFAEKKGV